MADRRHVDIIRNDWFNGQQVLAARVIVNGHGLEVESYLGEEWETLLRRPVEDRKTHAIIGPDDADHYLDLLPSVWNGSYFFANTPHDDASCEFGDEHSAVVRMVPPSATV